MTNTVTTDLHNGISAYSLNRAGICTGTMVFGVGFRDEPAAMAGITHLVEHLLLRMVHPMPLHHGARVDVDSVEFHAIGESEVVGGFFNAIAVAIANFASVSEEALALEKTVVEAENPAAFCGVSGGLLTYRFGARGPGVGQFGAPSTAGLSREETIAWVDRWIVAENSALTFTGSVPDSLDVRLPSGGRTHRQHQEPLIMEPTVIRSAKEGVALSFIVPTDVSAFFGEALRYELLDQLSNGRGLIYSIDIITTALDAGRCQLDLVLDPVESNVRVTFIEAVTAVRNLAENGFGANAMLNARRSLEAELAWDDNSAAFAYLGQLAVDRLLERPTTSPTEMLDRAAVISPEELNEVLRSALGNLVVAVDQDARVKRKEAKALGMVLDPYEIWQPSAHIRDEEAFQESMVGHRVWRHKSSKALVWLTSTHLWRRRGGKTKSIDLAGVVLVGERACGCIALIDGRGRSDELPTEDWKHGRTLRSALLSAFPVGTVRTFPEK
jgi:hypothetical protein